MIKHRNIQQNLSFIISLLLILAIIITYGQVSNFDFLVMTTNYFSLKTVMFKAVSPCMELYGSLLPIMKLTGIPLAWLSHIRISMKLSCTIMNLLKLIPTMQVRTAALEVF